MGEIAGYWEAHQLAGRLPWKDLFLPTINLCENGFKISRSLASALSGREARIKANKGLSQIFINPLTNSVYRQNDTIKRLNYARTLRNISEHGPQIIYNGLYTGIIVSEINSQGGNVTLDDFINYKPRVHENRMVIRIDERLRAYVPPPPSSGVLVVAAMKIMAGFGLEMEQDMSNESKVVFYHRLVETFKHLYARRTFMGDELFVNITSV